MSMNNELYHYGILGMKWGIRRARKKGTTYQYKSMYTKSYEKAAKKLRNYGSKQEIAEAERKAVESQKIDDRMQKIAENTSVGKGIAHLLFSSPIGGSRHYLQTKAIKGRPDAMKTQAIRQIGVQAVGLLGNYLNFPVLGPVSVGLNEGHALSEREIAIKKAIGTGKKSK